MTNKPKRVVSVRLSEETVQALNHYAKVYNRPTSGIVEMALRQMFDNESRLIQRPPTKAGNKYKLLTSGTPSELEALVATAVGVGWALYGSPSVCVIEDAEEGAIYTFMQAIIARDATAEELPLRSAKRMATVVKGGNALKKAKLV